MNAEIDGQETAMTEQVKITGENRLPGDPSKDEMVERIIRVDHAGEFGAQRIYEGQIAVLGKTQDGPLLRHMLEQEMEHLHTFEDLMNERHVRPTILSPIWHVAGFALGAGTALMGREAAMACTEAIEETIDEHYAHQSAQLGEDEADLKAKIDQFRAEEQEHRDIARENDAKQAPAYELLTGAIKAGSKAAIWLSSRI